MLEVTHDGKWIAAAVPYRDNQIRGRATAGPEARVRQLPVEGAKYIHFLADGHGLFAASQTHVMSWRLPDLQPGPTWTTLSDGDVWRALAFPGDGRWLASAAARNVVEIRDVRAVKLLFQLESPTDFQRIAWSADGAQLYLLDVADDETRLFRWNVIARAASSRPADWTVDVLFRPRGCDCQRRP